MSAKCKRAQAMLTDLVIGLTIFLLIFVTNYYEWQSINNKVVNSEYTHYFESSIFKTVDSLIKKSGEPVNWQYNVSGIISIGLADKENILNNEKLAALKNMPYENNSDYVLSTGEYQIEITNQKGEIIYSSGKAPKGTVVRVERIIRINDSYYNFIFKGWQ